MKDSKQPNPDDRSDNPEKLESMISDTLENIDETEERMSHASNDERETLMRKNKRREEAVKSFKNEIQDELEQ